MLGRVWKKNSYVLMFLKMDSKTINVHLSESSDRGVTSLEGLYTDFDGWLSRSIYFSKEISTEVVQNDKKPSGDAIFAYDVFIGDLLSKYRGPRSSAQAPLLNIYKENDGFAFYDLVLYRLMKQNSDKKLAYQYSRSKL